MKLSIITVCYNEPELEKTCKSIVNQTFQDFEWIVIDGGSSKETLDIFNKYMDRIDIFISEKDNGKYNAMNKGIELAQGEYLNFLNAGDMYFYDEVLDDVFKNKNRKAGILYGHEIFMYNNFYSNYANEMPEKIDKNFLYKSSLRHQATFIRKELFEKYGNYNENYDIASDYEKWIIFLDNGETFERLPYIISKFNTMGISVNEKSKKIANNERQEIIDNNYTKQELELIKSSSKSKQKYTFIENIYSLKDNRDGKHRILTILGVHVKVRRK